MFRYYVSWEDFSAFCKFSQRRLRGPMEEAAKTIKILQKIDWKLNPDDPANRALGTFDTTAADSAFKVCGGQKIHLEVAMNERKLAMKGKVHMADERKWR